MESLTSEQVKQYTKNNMSAFSELKGGVSTGKLQRCQEAKKDV